LKVQVQEEAMGWFTRKKAASTTDATAAATVAELPATGRYTIDATHTTVGFAARHAMVTTVRGQFDEFEGHAHFDAANPAASTATLVIQAASIDTRQADRDAHLRSADFFDAEAHPEIRFTSTAASFTAPDSWTLTGDLTIKDTTRPVTIDFTYTGAATDPFGNQRIGFEGRTQVNRKDWGLTWNAPLETGGVLVGEKVTLEFDVSAIATADANA
jgi:polyisoprenoid-binding protein YceI